MMVEDFERAQEVTKPEDVEAALGKRYGDGINSFWLSDELGKFPAINIAVKGGLAYVHYFPGGDHPGFGSVAKILDSKSKEMDVFFISPGERIWVPNNHVVPFSEALKAAQEFSMSKTMPKCIQWDSLVDGE